MSISMSSFWLSELLWQNCEVLSLTLTDRKYLYVANLHSSRVFSSIFLLSTRASYSVSLCFVCVVEPDTCSFHSHHHSAVAHNHFDQYRKKLFYSQQKLGISTNQLKLAVGRPDKKKTTGYELWAKYHATRYNSVCQYFCVCL